MVSSIAVFILVSIFGRGEEEKRETISGDGSVICGVWMAVHRRGIKGVFDFCGLTRGLWS